MRRFRCYLLLCGVIASVAGCGFAGSGNSPATNKKATGLPRSEEEQPSAPPVVDHSPNPASLIVPLRASDKARELVRRLGNADVRERDDAEKQLIAMGRLARPALTEGVTGATDPEVRTRCAALLPSASDEEMKARIRSFLADVNGKYDHDLPGVRVYLKHSGTSANGVALAAAVFRYPENRELFAAIEKGNAAGGRALYGYRERVYHAMQPKQWVEGKSSGGVEPILEYTAAIFVGEIAVSSDDLPKNLPVNWSDGTSFMYATPHRHALAGFGPHTQAYHEIVAKWIATRTTPRELHYLDSPLSYYLRGFEEALPAFRRIALTPGVDARIKCSALKILVQFYKKEVAMPVLLRALKDDALIEMVRFPKPDGTADTYPSRVQDVARAFVLHLHNEDIESYGYEYNPIYGPGRFADIHFIRNGGYAIRTEEQRTTAAVRFGWWQMKQSMKDTK